MSDDSRDRKDSPRSERPSGRSLRDQLADLELDLPARTPATRRDEESAPPEHDHRGHERRGASAHDRHDAPPAEEEIDDEELFERSIENLTEDDIYRAKYRDRDRAPRRRSAERREPGSGQPSPSGREPPVAPARPDREASSAATDPKRPGTEREMFEQAVESMDRAELYRGKYAGEVADLPPEPEKAPEDLEPAERLEGIEQKIDEEEARRGLEHARDQRLFEEFVGEVDDLDDRDKYHRAGPRHSRVEAALEPRPFSSEPAEGMVTPSLPKEGKGLTKVPPLDESQRALRDRYRAASYRHDVPEVNLRGDGVDDALRQLELTIHRAWKEEDRFVRVIHGRGLRSPGGKPSLKPAILHWLEGPGFRYVRGYVPERTRGGDYGSLIVELTERERRDED